MRIGLIDVDGHNFPSLPLMKISAYHKQIGDSVEWYEPLFSGHMDKVYMSKVFSFTEDYEYFVDADEVEKGGTGYFYPDGGESLPDEIEHIYPDYSIYHDRIPETKNTAYGFLTRGCPRGCDFCIVGKKEGTTAKKSGGFKRVLERTDKYSYFRCEYVRVQRLERVKRSAYKERSMGGFFAGMRHKNHDTGQSGTYKADENKAYTFCVG